jgi:hypothetical protein
MNLYHEESGAGKSNIDWREVMKFMDELKGWNNAKDND